MTSAARCGPGSGSSRSAAALRMAATMAAVESSSVPSQSNTTASKRSSTTQRLQQQFAVWRKAGRKFDRFASDRVREPHPRCVQEHPRIARTELAARHCMVQLEVSILVVPDDGKAQVRQMNADLMGAPGPKFRIEQREPLEAFAQLEHGVRRRSALGIDPDLAAGSGAGAAPGQRQPDVLPIVQPPTRDQRQVMLFDLAFT